MRSVGRQAHAEGINLLLYGTDEHIRPDIEKPLGIGTKNKSARDAVVKVLPVLSGTNADLISAESHLTLNKCLKSNDKELVLAVLDALPRIGTQIALPHVEALANMQVKPGEDIEVREMAMARLPLLKDRISEQNTMTLLRASQPIHSGEELLRAAVGESATSPEQLLRAHATETESPTQSAENAGST